MKIKNKSCFYLILLALVLVMSLVGESPVVAQTTTLSLSPVTAVALTCTDTTIAVRVENVADLYSYDVWLEFTPGSIEVWEVTNGSFLTYGYYNLPVVVDNSTGSIHITMTQLDPAQPQSGSGDLIYIRLRALQTGASFDVKFDDDPNHPTELFTRLGDPITFSSFDGTYTTADCEPADLFMDPSPATLCVGYPYNIYVRVENVLDFYSYDLDLTFNPGAVAISSVTNADFLSQGIFAPGNGFNNDNGTVNFGMTQILEGTNPPRDGSGNLIKIALQATEAGHTVVFNIAETSILASWSDYYSAASIDYVATSGTYYTAICDPTAVIFGDMSVQLDPNLTSVTVFWNTLSEMNLFGFNVYRSETLLGTREKLNDTLIPAIYQIGGEYYFIDDTVLSGHTYYYWIEALMGDGTEELGPKDIFVGSRIFLPLINKN